MSKIVGLSCEGRRPYRLAICSFLSGVFTVVLVLYFVAAFYSSTPWLQRLSADIARPLARPATPEQHGSFTLHPKDHVFRKPTTIRMTWNVTREMRAPDGVQKLVYLINGEFPGPTVEARPGDAIEINVFNHVQNDTEGIAVHWHGLLMSGANAMDGAVGVTQCTIPHAQNLTYSFTLDESQHGTFWYHAHSHVQRADGLYGGFIIHKPVQKHRAASDLSKYRYEDEALLMIGDWHHRSAREVLEWYRDPDHYGYEPAPDSLLVNGRGAYNCSNAVKARPINCTIIHTPPLHLPNSDRVRLRVINTGASAGYSMVIKHGTMQLITVDGGGSVAENTLPAQAIGILYPGERMDVVLDRTGSFRAGHEKSNGMTIELDRENMPLKNFALTRIQTFPLIDSGLLPIVKRDAQEQETGDSAPPLNLADVQGVAVQKDAAVLQQPSEKAVLYTTVQIRSSNHNQPVGVFNHTSWIVADQRAKPLLALEEAEWQQVTMQPNNLQKLDIPSFPANHGRWIDLVINNMDDKGHPFHMHGHSFHVVLSHEADAGEYGAYNPFDPSSKHPEYPSTPFAPLVKDTVYVPPMGYVVLRFELNNPGLWLMHCHVLWHQAVGMGMVFKIGQIDPGEKERAGKYCKN